MRCGAKNCRFYFGALGNICRFARSHVKLEIICYGRDKDGAMKYEIYFPKSAGGFVAQLAFCGLSFAAKKGQCGNEEIKKVYR